MKVKAIARDTGVSAEKVRPMADLVRGKKVDEALTILGSQVKHASRVVSKLVKSAVADAENNFQLSAQDLRIVTIMADEARPLKRFRPRARGRVNPIRKRSSHITIVVSEQEE